MLNPTVRRRSIGRAKRRFFRRGEKENANHELIETTDRNCNLRCPKSWHIRNQRPYPRRRVSRLKGRAESSQQRKLKKSTTLRVAQSEWSIMAATLSRWNVWKANFPRVRGFHLGKHDCRSFQKANQSFRRSDKQGPHDHGSSR